MAQSERQGYHLLSEFMSWAPNTAIFPRFKSSNLLNLLLLQAEISKLEEDFGFYAETGDKKALVDWEVLRDLKEDHPTKRTLQKLRQKLDLYSKRASLHL